jgi:mannose-6-phosphate isomerase-like protein (cupin superfamily)
VITGELAVKIGNDEFALDTGDSIYFDSSVPHSNRRTGKKSATALLLPSDKGPSAAPFPLRIA